MIELLSNSEMAEADRLTIANGTPGFTLMRQAGAAVADAITGGWPTGTQVTIVAGTGNNGGDGFVAARVLRERQYGTRVLIVGNAARMEGDAAQAYQAWNGTSEPATPDSLAGSKVIVDALFGAGLDRPVDGHPRAVIEAMNATGAPIVAVDLPSGISGDS